MSSPATLTVGTANSRSCAGEAGAGRIGPERERIMFAPAAEIIPPIDCTCSEYSPGVTPLSVNVAVLVGPRRAARHESCIASFIAGISMTIAPVIGLPSEPTALPVIFASFTG